MRILLPVLTTAALLATGGVAAPAGAAPSTSTGAGEAAPAGLQKAAKAPPGKATRPAGVNPYLALPPHSEKVDYAGWRRYLAGQGDKRAAQRSLTSLQAPARPPVLVDEDEPRGIRGSNDRPATAQRVSGFGTAAGRNPRARLVGTLSPERVPIVAVPPNAENDGSIRRARDTRISGTQAGISTTGVVGDGPHGSAGSGSGDFDFYRLTATAGRTITADIDGRGDGMLDSMLVLYDASGEVVAFNDDDGSSLDSLLRFPVPAAGTYYLMVTGFPSFPEDPFSSRSGTGAGSEGPYALRLSVAVPDRDLYSLPLRKGDVLGASVEGAAGRIAVYDAAPRVEDVHGSSQDASFIYPSASPLPGGGKAVTEHVADQDGVHYISVEAGDGSYDVTVEAYRPPLMKSGAVQTLYLDFDGARVNTGIFGGPGVRQLSPLRAFLGRWGMTNAHLNPLIDGIVAEVRENLSHDLRARGLNPDQALRILNSRDHSDPWGQPNVSRIVVGGTIEQSGIPTIGIAQSIDPGNFETEETALVLLDVLSDPAGGESREASLNTYLRSRSNRVAFVAQAVGNVTSHEAGHFFGDWHVDQFNDKANIMDQGGNFSVLYGVGADGVGGTADDPDVDFGEDVFNPNEGFTGIEDTLTRLSFGLSR